MKNQALFSLIDKSKILKCRPLQFLFGALRLNICDIVCRIKRCVAEALSKSLGQVL